MLGMPDFVNASFRSVCGKRKSKQGQPRGSFCLLTLQRDRGKRRQEYDADSIFPVNCRRPRMYERHEFPFVDIVVSVLFSCLCVTLCPFTPRSHLIIRLDSGTHSDNNHVYLYGEAEERASHMLVWKRLSASDMQTKGGQDVACPHS